MNRHLGRVPVFMLLVLVLCATGTICQAAEPLQATQLQAAQFSYPKTAAELKARLPRTAPYVFGQPPANLPPSGKVLIVLQENSGRVNILDDLRDSGFPPELLALAQAVVDTFAETFEELKARLQGIGKYEKVILLTDENGTYENLSRNLIDQSRQNKIIDLVILGHGNTETLGLKTQQLKGGVYSGQPLTGTVRMIQKLKNDFQTAGVTSKLRLVYMCNCWGSTTNDDWRVVGAKVSIGPTGRNAMPEPQITFFINDWLGGKTASQAATDSWNGSKPFYLLAYPPVITTGTKPQVISVPCGGSWDLTKFPPVLVTKYCQVTVQVPDVRVSDNPHITSSKPSVSGEGTLKF